ncbi:hypothetical protein [Actinopolymorpha rutila]|uniref:Uncharacterized protein n=1 Tax=Actinopolymorpha rutila TaxID=446787 RepID=A0A852ZKU8_9ACTN|nr:hypothetical protein [Actinopolymorpha rutila]
MQEGRDLHALLLPGPDRLVDGALDLLLYVGHWCHGWCLPRDVLAEPERGVGLVSYRLPGPEELIAVGRADLTGG